MTDVLRRTLRQLGGDEELHVLHAVLSDAMRLQVLRRLKGTVRHDFASPFQAAVFTVDLFLKHVQQASSEEQRQRVAQVADAGKKELARLERAIARMVDEVGAPDVERQRVDLCRMVEELHQWMQSEASFLDVRFEVRRPKAEVCTDGRRDQIRLLLALVMLNGLDALAAGGSLVIEVQHDARWAAVELRAAGLKREARWGAVMLEPDWSEPLALLGIGPFVARWTASLHGGEVECARHDQDGTLCVRLPNSTQQS